MDKRTLYIVCALFLVPATAGAYVGPGAGLSLLGALWALLVALGTALVFVIAWPVRRLLRRRRASAEDARQQARDAAREEARREAARRPGPEHDADAPLPSKRP